MKIPSALTLFLFSVSISYAQWIGFDQVVEDGISDWPVDEIADYEGTYHFGDSEEESTLILIIDDSGVTAQVKSGGWNADATDWIWHFKNLDEIKIDKEGNFQTSKYNGQFVNYEEAGKKLKCLMLVKTWTAFVGEDEYEVGWKTGYVENYYTGNYPEASYKLFSDQDLDNLDLQQLKIMRNEIFARYGYIFKSGGAMEAHFKKQDWYRGQHQDVNAFLTDLEKSNIALIRRLEMNR